MKKSTKATTTTTMTEEELNMDFAKTNKSVRTFSRIADVFLITAGISVVAMAVTTVLKNKEIIIDTVVDTADTAVDSLIERL